MLKKYWDKLDKFKGGKYEYYNIAKKKKIILQYK